jgi:hypothetical protein
MLGFVIKLQLINNFKDMNTFAENTPVGLDEPTTILILKIAFIVAVFAIALVFGLMPAKIKGCG